MIALKMQSDGRRLGHLPGRLSLYERATALRAKSEEATDTFRHGTRRLLSRAYRPLGPVREQSNLEAFFCDTPGFLRALEGSTMLW